MSQGILLHRRPSISRSLQKSQKDHLLGVSKNLFVSTKHIQSIIKQVPLAKQTVDSQASTRNSGSNKMVQSDHKNICRVPKSKVSFDGRVKKQVQILEDSVTTDCQESVQLRMIRVLDRLDFLASGYDQMIQEDEEYLQQLEKRQLVQSRILVQSNCLLSQHKEQNWDFLASENGGVLPRVQRATRRPDLIDKNQSVSGSTTEEIGGYSKVSGPPLKGKQLLIRSKSQPSSSTSNVYLSYKSKLLINGKELN